MNVLKMIKKIGYLNLKEKKTMSRRTSELNDVGYCIRFDAFHGE